MDKRVLKKVCLILVVVLFGLVGGWKNIQESCQMLASSSSKGTILAIDSNGVSYAYSVRGGRFEGRFDSSKTARHQVGETVDVYYEPSNPAHSMMYSPHAYLLQCVVALLVYSLIVFLGDFLKLFYKDQTSHQTNLIQREQSTVTASKEPGLLSALKSVCIKTAIFIGLAVFVLLFLFLSLAFGLGIFTALEIGWKVVSAILFLICVSAFWVFAVFSFKVMRDMVSGNRSSQL